ncbi:MAG: alpha-2-macroglobulin [Prochloraceae cyanobacterium]|nr:alpha-2-macroglobulin [Prochloraceae cyanobacterium]
MRIKKWTRLLLLFFLVAGLTTGCNLFQVSNKPEPLPAVEAIPTPELAEWIEQISPTGDAGTLAQIRIRFKDPLIPVEAIDTPAQQKLLQKFEITPPLPGKFRFLTPRMVGFQADKAIPLATRVKVTLKAGLKDLSDRELTEDLAWTFQTEPIALTNLPVTRNNSRYDSQPTSLKPTFNITSNVELDLDSVKDRVKISPEDEDNSIALKVALKREEADAKNSRPQDKFDPSKQNWIYTIKPKKALKKDTSYSIEFFPGLRPVRGNLLSEKAFSSQFKTHGNLAFQKIEYYGGIDSGGSYGRFEKGSANLKFNNGLVAESALENITIKPEPKKNVRSLQVYDGNNSVAINPWALEPNQTYTITIGAKVEDKFGQTLEKPVTVKYETGDVIPDIWAPSGLNIFPTGKNINLNISTVNLSEYKAAYQTVKPTDLVYKNSAYPSGNSGDLLPSADKWETFKAGGKKNQSHDNTVPLRKQLGAPTGMLAYGVKARTNSYKVNGKQYWREPLFYGFVQLTNLGVFSQWFPDSGLIRVHHLADGSAVENSTVEIYQSQLWAKNRPQPQACATGKTDESGTLILRGQNWQNCLKDKNPPQLLVIAREGKDWAFARTFEYSGAYGYGIDAVGWDKGNIESRGTIFSDRQLYQPGEKAAFTGTAYYLRNGELQQDTNSPYQVTLIGPDGKKKNLGTYNTNQFGTFSLDLDLEKNIPVGNYSLNAKGNNGLNIYGQFRVAEFKPPNFKVDLKLDKKFAFIDDKITAKAESDYLFGSPVRGGKVKYYVTRTRSYFKPQGWEKFDFGRQWFWPENAPQVPNYTLQSNQELNNVGKSTQIIPVGKDLPYPMTYRVDAEVSDVSNLSVSNNQTFTALPSKRLIGLRSDFVADAKKPFEIELIVTDPTGKAISGERVKVELQEIKYSSVTQITEGSTTDRNQVQYKTVKQVQVRSAKTPQTVSITPPDSGSYRIRANFAKSKTETTATDKQIWVTGDTPSYWGSRYTNNRLEIKLDKEEYKPGETATALIQSPYPEAELYFAIVRRNTIYKTIQKIEGGAPKIHFPVTEDMVPNAAVQAILVRQGQPIQEVKPGTVDNLVKIGFAPFKTNLEDKYLQVNVNPTEEKLQPGSQQKLELDLKDSEGKPVEGQFTIAVVNEAVLQLSGYRLPDLVKTVYSQQNISTRFSDNRPDVTLETMSSPLRKGWGYGGGDSSSAASTRIRTDFRPLAYYNGSVITNSQGKAEFTFELPEDLTTWRVMAVATDGDLHFGNGDATFITTKPLLSNPILPQFVRRGDRFLAGLSVTNTTGKTGNLSVEGTLKGDLEFAKNSQQTNKLTTQAKLGTKGYRFEMLATKEGEGKVQFITRLDRDNSDAFEVPLEIKQLDVSEAAIESGVTSDRVEIPLNIDTKVVPDAGGLELSLASTLIPEITAPAKQILDDSLPFLEPVASQLSIASNLQILGEKYGQTFAEFNPTQKATSALLNLQKLQKPDGGFSYIPQGKKSNPFITPYAAQSIASAQKAGFEIDPNMLKTLKSYLNRILANPDRNSYCITSTCKQQIRLNALIALAELNDIRTDYLSSLYESHNDFDLVGKIKLTSYLSQFPQWQEQAQTLFDELQETVYETGRTAKINLPDRWGWYNSNTVAQARALQLFIDRKADLEQIDRLLKGLLEMRRDGIWRNNYENAQALAALVEYSKFQPTPPNFTATVQIDRQKLEEVQFQGYAKPSVEIKVPMEQLPKGRNNLILQKSGRGTLHYLTAYRYRLKGNQPGRLNGLRVTRYLRPANEDRVLQKFGLYANEDSFNLPAGQVFDLSLEIITDHPVNNVVVSDPLPAGLEAVDSSFQTATSYFQAQQDSWEISYQKIYKDRVVAYGDRLDPGVYTMHYLVRSVTPGTFEWPGAEVHLQYAPEEFGRCASSVLEIKE